MNRKVIERTVTVYRVTRGRQSNNGNPSFIFHTDEGEYRTQTDTSCAYTVESHFDVGTGVWRADDDHEWRNHDGKDPALVVLRMTPARRVFAYWVTVERNRA